MDISSIISLANSYSRHPKRHGVDFDVQDILAALDAADISCTERRLYNLIKRLGLTKNASGFYGQAEVTVIVGWLTSNDQYTSCNQYVEVNGRRLYEHAKLVFGG